jgi:hypothetical protein
MRVNGIIKKQNILSFDIDKRLLFYTRSNHRYVEKGCLHYFPDDLRVHKNGSSVALKKVVN